MQRILSFIDEQAWALPPGSYGGYSGYQTCLPLLLLPRIAAPARLPIRHWAIIAPAGGKGGAQRRRCW